jgi:CubicO group peptidase (beta-lactamase class C family)
MAKTVTAMLVGIAIAEGRIRSVDDPVAAYLRRSAEDPGVRETNALWSAVVRQFGG